MIVGFDLDGTLYNTIPISFSIFSDIRQEMGYPNIPRSEFVSKFQTKNFRELYLNLGFKEEDINPAIEEFIKRFKSAEPPVLICGAKGLLQKTKKTIGYDNMYIITNETTEGVIKRFENDGLISYLSRVHNPHEGKANELYYIARKHEKEDFFYIGDLVSDGEECKEAILKGAKNLKFCGITHKYAINTKKAMTNFVNENKDFARTIKNFKDINKLLCEK